MKSDSSIPAEQQWRGRLMLLLLASLFFGPLLLASLWYSHADRWPLPEQRANHGQLISPARPLSTLKLLDLKGKLIPAERLQGRWSLVYLGSPVCDAKCEHLLYQTRQVRTALGKDTDRVQRVYLLASVPPDPARLEALRSLHPDLLLAVLASPETVAQFPEADAAVLWSGQQLYVVDPLGNLMMRYGADQDPKDMLADFKRLLRLSHIG
jgi:cytochrome oxidase Cu insertion factor (SCO1/SenC/PrrC family)